MSNVKITDKRGGLYNITIEFTYGECERLPFNILRKSGAKISVIPDGGILAVTEFNIRNPKEANLFLSILDMFGEDGSFIHGSAADPSLVSKKSPTDDDILKQSSEIKHTSNATNNDDDLEIEN